ncbi:MAG: hypothetical protein HYX63_06950 [Gammaproteobacteria bacterium]|nr:hypothetical protein [Gammaproteobacteria bacterium]
MSLASVDVHYQVADGVATITIDRPQVHNAFREQTMRELIVASIRHRFEALHCIYDTPEFHEGTRAYLERRAPRFR